MGDNKKRLEESRHRLSCLDRQILTTYYQPLGLASEPFSASLIDSRNQAMNPIDNLMRDLGYKPILPSLRDLPVQSTVDRFVSEAHHLVTVPRAHNYLPLYRPDDSTYDEWIFKAQNNYIRSMHHFIGDIWTTILCRKAKKKSSLHILWDSEIPTPTPATALFWLMLCESWPLPISNRMMPGGGIDLVRDLYRHFPPQPFLLPQSQHPTTTSIHPVGFVRSRDTPDNLMGIELSRSLTQADREKMEFTPSWWQPIFMPAKPTMIEDHITSRQDSGIFWSSGFERRVDIEYNSFVNRPISFEVSGYALQSISESYDHLYNLWNVRQNVMNQAQVKPGIPTCDHNLYGAVGGWIRGYSEGSSVLLGTQPLQWVDSGSVNIDDQMQLTEIPNILPSIWFGFTGQGMWSQSNETCKAATLWANIYQQVRAYGLEMLFRPDRVDWAKIEDEELRARTAKIKRAGLLTTQTKKKSTVAEAMFALNIIED
jgi:hypothetical protein